MRTETIAEWQARTKKKIKKVDFKDAYKFKDTYRGHFVDYTKTKNAKKVGFSGPTKNCQY